MENGQEAIRRRNAKAWLAFAVVLMAFCIIAPHFGPEPELISRDFVSIYLFWLSSPIAATAAGYGIAGLMGERPGKGIFIALTIAVFVDLWLLPIAIHS